MEEWNLMIPGVLLGYLIKWYAEVYLSIGKHRRKLVVQKQNRMDFFTYKKIIPFAKYLLWNSFKYILIDIKVLTWDWEFKTSCRNVLIIESIKVVLPSSIDSEVIRTVYSWHVNILFYIPSQCYIRESKPPFGFSALHFKNV